ncbi:hypothetical protein KM043_002135 [Ampulex compressa]|nr:hypothetical protein KM043_002135 [Ampulex compressa]
MLPKINNVLIVKREKGNSGALGLISDPSRGCARLSPLIRGKTAASSPRTSSLADLHPQFAARRGTRRASGSGAINLPDLGLTLGDPAPRRNGGALRHGRGSCRHVILFLCLRGPFSSLGALWGTNGGHAPVADVP